MRDDLVSAFIQFDDQRPVLGRVVEHGGRIANPVGEKFD